MPEQQHVFNGRILLLTIFKATHFLHNSLQHFCYIKFAAFFALLSPRSLFGVLNTIVQDFMYVSVHGGSCSM